MSVLKFSLIVASLLVAFASTASDSIKKEEAVRVVRLQIHYNNASMAEIGETAKWNSMLRSSLLASLRFINKHWLICGGTDKDKLSSTDCGKAHITGESVGGSGYRVNVTFIAERDPVKNAKVEATSTVFGVIQIGLKGGIFQYTNALKVLGRPETDLSFDEQFFCYKGFTLSQGHKCIKNINRRLADQPIDSIEDHDLTHLF